MLLAIIDLETTGVNHNVDLVCELGVVLYSVEYTAVVEAYSTLFPVYQNAAQSINGISPELAQLGSPNIEHLESVLWRADYAVIHNKGFDTKWFNGHILQPLQLPVICSMNDIEFPKSKNKKLMEIANDHKVGIYNAHRALSDCMLLANIFSTYTPEELQRIISRALQPKVLYVSMEAYPGTLSKEAGFTWDKILSKKWAKYMHPEDVAGLGFRVYEHVEGM